MRRIAHIDCDAFFASVEQLDNPELRGKPVAVGSLENRRGVVATCSYEARKFGIHSAMPSYQAIQLCPHILFVKPRGQRYREVSYQIGEIFKQFTDVIEFASIDEAYLDLTDRVDESPDRFMLNAEETLMVIKKHIKSEIGITVTAGLSVNKFLAKLASEIRKPDGFTEIKPDEIQSFLYNAPIGDFRGIGKKTEAFMLSMGINVGGDLLQYSKNDLVGLFGDRKADWLYNIVRGIDDRSVDTSDEDRKSINVSETFQYDVMRDKDAYEELKLIVDEVWRRMEYNKMFGRTVTIKVKYNDFKMTTRSLSCGSHITNKDDIEKICLKLLKKDPLSKPIRLLGISISNFTNYMSI